MFFCTVNFTFLSDVNHEMDDCMVGGGPPPPTVHPVMHQRYNVTIGLLYFKSQIFPLFIARLRNTAVFYTVPTNVVRGFTKEEKKIEKKKKNVCFFFLFAYLPSLIPLQS